MTFRTGPLAAALLLSAATVSAQSLQLEDHPRRPEPIVASASEDGQLAIQRITLAPGLKARLWAAEPMLANPVAIAFDEKGRLFVSETHRYGSSVLDIRGYMGMVELDLASRTIEDRSAMLQRVFGAEQVKQLGVESEVVRLIEDRDGDGVADTSNLFAAGFNDPLDGIASGVLARRGKVWFTNIPSLWLLEESASGQPPKRTELLRGFGVRFNFTGHDLHGLIIGHDGKLYFSVGDRGAHVPTKEGGAVAVPDEGAVFRANLDGTQLELFARGLRNPQELAFDEHGNLFTGDNDSDQGDMERLVYLVEGGDSGWRVGYQYPPLGGGGPWIRENLWKPRFPGQPAYLLPPIANIEDGPSGLAYYPGTGLTPEYRGQFFITHFKGSIARSGVHMYSVTPAGAGFAIKDSKPFLSGLLTTDVTFGPDGVLYVSDWVEGWPKSTKGRIYAIEPAEEDAAQKQQRAELARLLASDFRALNVTALRQLLAHPDRRVRLEAQFALVERNAISTLRQVAVSTPAAPLARLHAVWGLTQIGAKHPEPARVLTRLLSDPDAEVRAQAAKGLGDIGHEAAGNALVARLEDSAARVQFFAAQSLGKLRRTDATPALIELLRRNDDADSYLRHAAVHALARIGKSPALDAAAQDRSGAVRLGVLLAYRALKDPAIAQFLSDAEAYIAREAALAINDAAIEPAFPALGRKLAQVDPRDEAFVLRAINANFRLGTHESATALAEYARRDDVTAAMRTEALAQLAHWADVPQRDRIVGIYRPLPRRDVELATRALAPVAPGLLRSAPEAVQLAALDAIEKLKVSSVSRELVALIQNKQASGEVRAHALRTLDSFDSADLNAGIAAAEAADVPALRLAALQVLARRDAARALPVVRKLALEGSEEEQRAAFAALRELDRPETSQLLLLGLERLASGDVHPGAQFDLLDAVEASQDPKVKARWDQQQAAWAAGKDALAPFRGALAGGDVRRGAGVFYQHPVLPCVRCHKVNADGGEAGPDLTEIAAKQSLEYILESIVDPNAKIAAGFDLMTLVLKDGASESGSLVRESAREIVLKRPDGSEVSIDPQQIVERQAAPSSMPDIYKEVLSRSELRDLLAFMNVLRERETPEQTESRATSGH
jgi:quinoprotein glucose dehydrogenase